MTQKKVKKKEILIARCDSPSSETRGVFHDKLIFVSSVVKDTHERDHINLVVRRISARKLRISKYRSNLTVVC